MSSRHLERGFESIKRDWGKWQYRNDLFDEVVTRSVEFIAGFINQVGILKIPTLAALFIKRPGEADQVLEEIEYNDDALKYLANYRPELAESHDKFFKTIDKISDPERQESAVENGVIRLFTAKKHGSVLPLINALEERQFNGRNLKNPAIREAFDQGVFHGIKYIVEELHEHYVITPWHYANGLRISWRWDMSKMVFPFVLSQADKYDLEEVKRCDEYNEDQGFRDAIDEAFSNAEPAGSRHARFFGRPRLTIETLDDVMTTGVWKQEPGSIIASYLVGEQEWDKEMERMRSRQEDAALDIIEQNEEEFQGRGGKRIVSCKCLIL